MRICQVVLSIVLMIAGPGFAGEWVITEQLPDNGPAPQPGPVNPNPTPNPSPFVPPEPVAERCRCGCNREGCQCGRAAAAVQCDGGPVQAAGPLVVIDETAAPAPRSDNVIDGYIPRRCPSCPQWVANLGNGDGEYRINWIVAEPPAEIVAQTALVPAFAIRGRVLFADPSGKVWPQFEARAAELMQNQPVRVAALQIGTIRGRGVIDAILSAVTSNGAESVIELGGAQIVLPKGMRAGIAIEPGVVRIAFDNPRPVAKYRTGWFAAGRSLSSISATRDVLTLGIDGFPDVTFRLE